ncbi:MAG: arginine--tRNA ligase [Malacoplasma sp.]
MISSTFINLLEKKIVVAIKETFNIKFDKFVVDKTKNIKFGDFFSNVGIILSKKLSKNISQVNEALKKFLISNNPDIFLNIEIEQNGFINFFISYEYINKYILFVNKEKEQYGQFKPKNLFYNIEFVSANPTGSLHIGHARNAALGQTLANIFEKYGIKVDREYYINDAGAQIDKFAMSVFFRYLQLNKIKVVMPADFYNGDEPKEIATIILNTHKNKFLKSKYDETKIYDEKTFDFFKKFSKDQMLTMIKKDLLDFGVKFKRYYSESSIYEKNLIPKTLKKISKFTYEKDGALWLNTTKDGDDKDRVLIKNDKKMTYFTPDICYHHIKISRNYNKIFDIFGADHSSYVNRVRSSLISLGYSGNSLVAIIMQMVKLTKDGEEFKMSKRSGNSLTLRDLIKAIGVDSARWVLISQGSNTHIDIDVDQFTNKSFDNHLFYVYYAYARMLKIIKKFDSENKKDKSIRIDSSLLILPIEKELINMIFYYPCTIETISKFYETQKLVSFIYSLANLLNSYYEMATIFDVDNFDLTNSRICLLRASIYTIESALNLLNIKPKNKV